MGVFGCIVSIDLTVELNGLLELFVFLSLFTSEAARVCLFTKIIITPTHKTTICHPIGIILFVFEFIIVICTTFGLKNLYFCYFVIFFLKFRMFF